MPKPVLAFDPYFVGVLTFVIKTKTFTVLANQITLLVLRNVEKNLKNNSENNSVRKFNKSDFPKNLFCFHRNFCLRSGTELGSDSNYK